MQKLKSSLCVLVFVGATLALVVAFRMWAERQRVETQGPLTVEAIDRLVSRWEAFEETTPAEESPHRDEPLSAEDGTGDDAARAGAARPILARSLTADEKDRMAEQRPKKRMGWLLCPTIEFATTAGLCAGLSEEGAGIHYFEAAHIALHWTGDWSKAQRLFRQALDCPLTAEARQNSCLYLAMLEDDPHVATRLLELACPEDGARPFELAEAARLARLTGSRDLFEYYVDRLEALNPEQAAEFRTWEWLEAGQEKTMHARILN